MRSVEPDVVQAVESTWEAPDDRGFVLAQLSEYGVEPYEREGARVQLAILKLSQGQRDRIPDLVAAAKVDYRDVLVWAEYPEEGGAVWALRRELSPEEQAQLEEIRRRDRAGYESWLAEVRRRPPRG